MPRSYYARHSAEEIRAHARILTKRAGSLVVVEPCPGPPQPDGGQWMCVVTDDRAGLLSLLTAAISAHSLDILSARVYCRTRPHRIDEAIDLFSVRPLRNPSDRVDFDSIGRTIASLLRGEVDVGSLEKRAAETSRPAGPPSVAVYFDDTRDADVVVVEAGDRPGLLLAISLTIFRERLTIVRSHVTTFAATARDEFELAELDGSRLSASRKQSITDKIRDALIQETSERRSPNGASR